MALRAPRESEHGDRTYTRPCVELPVQDRGGAKFCGLGRARFVRVRTEVYTGERGPRLRGTERAAHARRTSGYRPAGLRREDARTHHGRAVRLAAGPHRWWLALDR